MMKKIIPIISGWKDQKMTSIYLSRRQVRFPLKLLFIDADKPESAFEDFQPRVPDMLYDVYPLDNKFLILTNWNAKNFRLMECPLNKTGSENWKEVIPVREDVLIAGIDEFKNFLVIKERKNGLVQMRINNLVDGKEYYLDFGEPAYTASSGGNPDIRQQPSIQL